MKYHRGSVLHSPGISEIQQVGNQLTTCLPFGPSICLTDLAIAITLGRARWNLANINHL